VYSRLGAGPGGVAATSEKRDEGNGVCNTRDALETGQECSFVWGLSGPTIRLMDEPVQTFPAEPAEIVGVPAHMRGDEGRLRIHGIDCRAPFISLSNRWIASISEGRLSL